MQLLAGLAFEAGPVFFCTCRAPRTCCAALIAGGYPLSWRRYK